MMADQLTTALIMEMKYVCLAIPVVEASLEIQPSYKMKPDSVTFEKNKALLQDGLECQVLRASSIDRETNKGQSAAAFAVYLKKTGLAITKVCVQDRILLLQDKKRLAPEIFRQRNHLSTNLLFQPPAETPAGALVRAQGRVKSHSWCS